MPPLLKTVILAVIQGITEFLPVSSSGHLLLLNRWLGLKSPGLALIVSLHFGTLISVLVYYRRKLFLILSQLLSRGSEGRRWAGAVIVGSIPVVVVGILLGHQMGHMDAHPRAIAGLLAFNGLLLVSLLLSSPRENVMSPLRALLIGAAQALAALPGISRSGSTIVAARHLGIPAKEAAEFSFLLYIPAVAGSAGYEWLTHRSDGFGELSLPLILAGIAVSAVVGYVALCLLVRALSSGKFWIFGVYCLAAGLAGLFLPL